MSPDRSAARGRSQSLSLEGLANRVAVSYLQTAPGQSGGRPALTDWAESRSALACTAFMSASLHWPRLRKSRQRHCGMPY